MANDSIFFLGAKRRPFPRATIFFSNEKKIYIKNQTIESGCLRRVTSFFFFSFFFYTPPKKNRWETCGSAIFLFKKKKKLFVFFSFGVANVQFLLRFFGRLQKKKGKNSFYFIFWPFHFLAGLAKKRFFFQFKETQKKNELPSPNAKLGKTR